jgi:hypothetical protein
MTTTTERPETRPVLRLTGTDGNAFSVLGLAGRAGRKAGWTKEQIDAYMAEAMAGDYNNLLAVTQEWFDVE